MRPDHDGHSWTGIAGSLRERYEDRHPRGVAEAERPTNRLVARALALDGTCTGEHGVGYGKVDFLIAEHGEAISVMRTIKKALDPDNLMNPGKIVRV